MRKFLLAFLLGLLIAAPVTAAPPNQIDWVYPFDVHFADVVPSTEALDFTSNHDRPWARIDCSVDGSVVYSQFVALFPGVAQSFIDIRFGPTPSWQGGGADCTAQLWVAKQPGFGPVGKGSEFVVLP